MEINLSPRLASFLGETEEGFQNMTPANNPSNPNYLNSSTLNNSSNDIHPDFHYNKHNESVFDDERLFPCLQSNGVGGELYKFDENNPELLNHATLKALIVQLTSPEIVDYNLICDFFLTYRMFAQSEEVMNLLLTRLIWSLQYITSNTEANVKVGKLVLLRTFVVLRHWIINYFIDDFESVPSLCDLFTRTINSLTINSNLINNRQVDEENDANHMVFEKKILGDLKIHWLNAINDFWKIDLDLEIITETRNILTYYIPLYEDITSTKKLSKTNTEMSIHTNPSYRRSAMLSLYDKRALHKCIIFDGNNEDENPQYSINNLLSQHQSSRLSLNTKLQELQEQQMSIKSPIFNNHLFNSPPIDRDQPTQSKLNLTSDQKQQNTNKHLTKTNRHNHMNLKDSSLGLKKTIKNNGENENFAFTNSTPHDKTFSNDKENTNESAVYSPKNTPNRPSRFDSSGFSTNGNIKLPTSKVTYILPPTPVRKMECIVKPNQDTNNTSTGSPLRRSNYQPPMKHEDEEDGFGRKRSIKKFIDGWKKTVHYKAGNPKKEDDNEVIDDDTPFINLALNGAIENNNVVGQRVDILSARIVDELEYLIRYYIRQENTPLTTIEDEHQEENSPVNTKNADSNNDKINTEVSDDEDHFGFGNLDVMGSPAKKPRISSTSTHEPMEGKIGNVMDELDISNEKDNDDVSMDINDLSDLNILKIDNLINDEISGSLRPNIPGSEEVQLGTLVNSQESSFQRPASINWNDAGNLDLENSAIRELDDDLDEEDEENGEGSFLENGNSSFDVPHEDSFNIVHEDSFDNVQESSLLHERVNSPRLLKSETQYFDVSTEMPPEPNINAMDDSGNSLNTSISTPSNITQYDADIAELGIALSPQLMKLQSQNQLKRISFSESINLQHRRVSIMSRNSRNSNGSSAFKHDSMKSYLSYDSAFSVSNGSRVSTRNEDTYMGLKKKDGHKNLRRIAGCNSNTPSDEVKSLDLPVKLRTTSMGSAISRSSSHRRSVRFSTLCALTELPFSYSQELVTSNIKNSILPRNSKLSDVADSSIFSMALKSARNSLKVENSNNSSANSIAIPGISSYVLKELAAIPDETFESNDPIEFALFKLEGKDSNSHIFQVKRIDRDDVGGEAIDREAIDREAIFRETSDREPIARSSVETKEQSPQITTESDHEDGLEDTEDILNQINNANTQDVIDMTNIEITPEIPLTPVKKRLIQTDTIPLTSTPNGEGIFNNSNITSSQTSPAMACPKIILDNYILSNDTLSVQKVMEGSSHISFVLSFDSKSIANHFTIIEKDMLQEVDWKELIELKWNNELTPVNSWLEIIVNDYYYNANKGVNLVIARFNLMVNWIISEIILTKDQFERTCIISRFIHIAQNCYALQNYSTLMQVILALTSERIQKLRETWKNLSPGDILMLKNLEELASPLKNFLNIRLCINQMKPSKGCIPFVGLYLSDLVFNAERPTFIKNKTNLKKNTTGTSSNAPDSDLSNSTFNSNAEFDKVVNFSKFRTSVHIVKSLSQCIEWSSNYDMSVNPELLSKCLYIKSLDEEEMNFCLKHMEDS
jgi:GDP/GTP exchange factor required for growth at low temperature